MCLCLFVCLQVDWWTLGILIFEMLASYTPFYHEDHMKMYSNHSFTCFLASVMFVCQQVPKDRARQNQISAPFQQCLSLSPLLSLSHMSCCVSVMIFTGSEGAG